MFDFGASRTATRCCPRPRCTRDPVLVAVAGKSAGALQRHVPFSPWCPLRKNSTSHKLRLNVSAVRGGP
ncbi:hypothetical protein K523DRAFT_323091 [Schizophyllum commune Tattone D]|nr:hypothetical protein K523DRAFT_323091 [Schizophyllum commune Tattone D]